MNRDREVRKSRNESMQQKVKELEGQLWNEAKQAVEAQQGYNLQPDCCWPSGPDEVPHDAC